MNNSTAIAQQDLLDLCAYRAEMRSDPEEPIERVRILFFEGERDARRYLHELWVREIECWYIDPAGREVRLDDSYEPERILPEWVERVEGTPPRVARPQVRLSLGLAALLANPEGEIHGDWCRDDLLHHITDWLEPEQREQNYFVMEVLGAHLPRVGAKPSDPDTGQILVYAGDGIGGRVTVDEAAALVEEVSQMKASVDLAFEPHRLGLTLPAIIVPDPYPRQRPIAFGNGHPLDGVTIHQVSDVMARVRSLNREDLREAESLLRHCEKNRLVLAAVSIEPSSSTVA